MTDKIGVYIAVASITILLAFGFSAVFVEGQINEGPSPELHDFELDIELDDKTEGMATYRVTVSGESEEDNLPFLYPVEMTYTETSSSNQELGNDVIYLSPTTSPGFVPDPSEGVIEDLEMQNQFFVNLVFDDLAADDDGNVPQGVNRRVEIEAVSRYTGDEDTQTDTLTMDGPPPSGSETGTVQASEGLDEPSSVSFVDSFKAQEGQTPDFGEDLSLPSPNSAQLDANLNNFNEMREPSGSANVISESSDINFVTFTENIQEAEPLILTITYDVVEGDEIELHPIDSSGSTINSDTEYVLPDDVDENDDCRALPDNDDVNLCVFHLAQDEVDNINSLGELLLHYEANEDVAATIGCQSVISGYVTIDGEACGSIDVELGDGQPIIEIFEGKEEDDEDWRGGEVNLDIEEDGEVTHDIQMRVDPSSIPSGLDVGARYEIYEGQGFRISGDEYEGQLVASGEFDDVSDPDIDAHTVNDVIDLGDVYLPENYIAVLCPRAGDCSPSNTFDGPELLRFTTQGDATPELRTNDPVRLELDVLDENELTVNTVTHETTDPDFPDSTTRDEDWDCVRGTGCGEPSRDEQFDGEIEETVVVEDIGPNEAERVRNGELLPEAESQLSDIQGGDWNTDDASYTLDQNFVDVVYTTGSPPSGDWEAMGVERLAQVGTDRSEFEIVDGGEFSSVVDSEESWYPLRGDSTTPSMSGTTVETKVQHVDPDECLNCLEAENMEEANERFDDITGVEIVETSGSDIWVRASDEPHEIVTLQERDVDVLRRSSDTGDVMTYDIFSEDVTDRYRFRNANMNDRNLYLWERTDGTPMVEFERPVTEEVVKYERGSYDVEYEVTADIQSPSELYEYTRDENVVEKVHDGEIAWIDIHQSQSNPSSGHLTAFTVQFENADFYTQVGWIEGVHDVNPNELDTDEVCDSGTTREELSDSLSGVGGTAVVEMCEIDGEERIIRIGKEYDDPRDEVYQADIELFTPSHSTQDTFDVIVDSEDDDVKTPSKPDLQNVELINDRVDYNLDYVPIRAELTSDIEELDEDYYLTVNPSDDVGTIGGCDEFTGYSEEHFFTLQSESNTGDTYREVTSCILNTFEDPDQANEEFTLYHEFDDGSGVTQEFEEIPSGAIQSCEDPLTEDENGNCIADEDNIGGLDTTYEVEFESGGTFESVDGEKLGGLCPAEYDREQTDVSDDFGQYDNAIQYTCELNTEIHFELRTRQTSVQYEDVRAGVVQQCYDIPVSSETGSHAGYNSVVEENDGLETINCVNQDDLGPDEFTLAQEEEVDGETQYDYQPIPAGAVRGEALDSGFEPSACEDTYIEDDEMYCDIDNNGETETVQYGTLNEGSWSSSADTVSRISDQGDATSIEWSGDFVLNRNEEVTILINPRLSDLSPTGENGVEDITVQLRRGHTAGQIIQEEEVSVQLCKAESVSSLPKSGLGFNECDEFDTLLTGEPDTVSDRDTIDDVLSDFEDSGTTSEEYEIETALNDACPYTHVFPRGHSEMSASDYTVTIEEGMTTAQVEEIIEEQLIPRYADMDAICDPSIDEEATQIPPNADDDNVLTFERSAFERGLSDREYVRYAGLQDIGHSTEHPTQSRWVRGDLGDALRIGTPVASGEDPNQRLWSMYTMDHDPTRSSVMMEYPAADEEYRVNAHNYVIQDVYNTYAATFNENHGRNDDTQSIGAMQARLWYGTPCAAEDGDGGQSQLSHQAAQPYQISSGVNRDANCGSVQGYYDGDGGYDNILTAEEAYEVFSPEHRDSLRYDTGFAGAASHREIVAENQAAFLPVPPTERFEEQYPLLTHNSQNNHVLPNSVTEDVIANNYRDGIFGGNSLMLDDTSWLMLSPPCIDRDSMTSQADQDDGTLGVGGSDIDPRECDNQMTGYEDADLELDEFRGGWMSSYADDNHIVDDIDETTASTNFHETIDSDDGYAISFWVNSENNYRGLESRVVDGDDYVLDPFSNIMSIDLGEDPDEENSHSMHSSFSMEHLAVPQYIDVSDIDTGTFEHRDAYRPEAWQYPEHLELREIWTFCTNKDHFDSAPIHCEVYEESNWNSVDDVTEYDDSDWEEQSRFRDEMIRRTEFEFSYDWATHEMRLSDNHDDITADYTDSGWGGQEWHRFNPDSYSDSSYLYNTGLSSSIPDDAGFHDEWQHMTINYDGDSVTVYVDGVRKSTLEELVQPSTGEPLEGGDTIDVGKIYEDSIVSIGGAIQQPGMADNPEDGNTDGQYTPYLTASGSEIKVDEIRIYDEPLAEVNEISQDDNMGELLPNQVYSEEFGVRYYGGTLETRAMSYDSENNNIGESIESNVMDVTVEADSSGGTNLVTSQRNEVGYEVEIIPCDSNDCYDSASDTIGDLQLAGELTTNTERASFDREVLNQEGVTEIDAVEMDITLLSEGIESTPLIHSVEIDPVAQPHNNCQELMNDYDGYLGSGDVTVELLASFTTTPTNCDFETHNGGWTKFAWADTSEGDSYSYETDTEDNPLIDDKTLSECDPHESDSCFTTPEFEIPDNMSPSDFGEDSESDINGQILIKAVEDDRTVQWAAFEFDPLANVIYDEEEEEFDEHIDEEMFWVSEIETIMQDGQNVETDDGLRGAPREDAIEPSDEVENCLYPYAHSTSFDSDSPCLTHIGHTSTQGGNTHFTLSERSLEQFGTDEFWSTDYTFVEWSRNNDNQELNNVECLDENVDRCELYYSVGSAFDSPDTELYDDRIVEYDVQLGTTEICLGSDTTLEVTATYGDGTQDELTSDSGYAFDSADSGTININDNEGTIDALQEGDITLSVSYLNEDTGATSRDKVNIDVVDCGGITQPGAFNLDNYTDDDATRTHQTYPFIDSPFGFEARGYQFIPQEDMQVEGIIGSVNPADDGTFGLYESNDYDLEEELIRITPTQSSGDTVTYPDIPEGVVLEEGQQYVILAQNSDIYSAVDDSGTFSRDSPPDVNWTELERQSEVQIEPQLVSYIGEPDPMNADRIEFDSRNHYPMIGIAYDRPD